MLTRPNPKALGATLYDAGSEKGGVSPRTNGGLIEP
jgi:hypothetical protein